jgi:hypothetical protein
MRTCIGRALDSGCFGACRDKDREAKLKNGTLFEETAGPSRDLSLKEGEKISIKLPVRLLAGLLVRLGHRMHLILVHPSSPPQPGAASKRRSGQPSSTGAGKPHT